MKQSVCNPKNDYEMRRFAANCGVVHVSEEKEIAKAVRETEEEMRKRGKELDNIGIQETDFQPLYYKKTAMRIATFVVVHCFLDLCYRHVNIRCCHW
ncbi:MAG: hypothetical protein K2K90_09970 [Lachnospiraceae bacterium]|nr:hypothetical protein [Lachnospiraceae bacterium]